MSYSPNNIPNPFENIAEALERINSRMERLEAALGVDGAPPLAGRPDLLTREEVAAQFSVHTKTIKNWEELGMLTPVKAGRRVLYAKDEVIRLMRAKKN
jgi:hypothetical protein